MEKFKSKRYILSIWNRKPGIYLMVTSDFIYYQSWYTFTYGGNLEDLISILVLMKVYLIIGRRLKEIETTGQSRRKWAVMVMEVITAIMTARMAVLAVMTYRK